MPRTARSGQLAPIAIGAVGAVGAVPALLFCSAVAPAKTRFAVARVVYWDCIPSAGSLLASRRMPR